MSASLASKTIALFAIVATLAAGEKPNVSSFEEYVQVFRKSYGGSEEYATRKAIFESKAAAVVAHNEAADRGEVTWYEAVNSLSDRTELELAAIRGYDRALGYNRVNEHSRVCNGAKNCARVSTIEGERYMSAFSVLSRDNKTSVDWRNEGVLTAVKDQAFEAAYALSEDGYLMNLSEQQVLDCTPNPHQCGGTGGCSGGIAEIAYDMIQSYGGLAGEWIYPYVSYMGKDSTCQFDKSMLSVGSSFKGNMTYMKLPTNEFDPLMAAIQRGPVAVSVDASTWSGYSGGVYDGCNQDSPVIDHGVLLVGYGTDPKLGDYWIIRNSWGAEWGENGFMRLRRTASEGSRCGTDTSPSEGIACKGDPPTQKVCGTCGILLDPVLPLVQ